MTTGAEPEIEGEVVSEEDGPAAEARHLPAVQEAQAPATLFGTDNPALVLEKATEVADALAGVIEKKKLYTTINGRKHIHVEGWTLLGSMMGVFPEIEWTKPTTDSNGKDAWEARCIARTRDGAIVGAREAMCSSAEPKWKNRDDYAIRSMAQTRAISGALASPLRFIVVLAGFEGTPEAEMPQPEREERREEKPQVAVPRTWEAVIAGMNALLGEDNATVWLTQSKQWMEETKARTGTVSPTLLQRLSGAYVDLAETGYDFEFTPGVRKIVQDVFASRLDGAVLEGPEWALEGPEAEAGRPSIADVLDKGDPDA